MSNLKPDMIGLDKGLDLQTAKIIAPKGSVLDSLNYEQVDFQGQKRIDGYTSYDGDVEPALYSYYRLYLTGTPPGGFDEIRWLVNSDNLLFGKVLAQDEENAAIDFVPINSNAFPIEGDMLEGLGEVNRIEIGTESTNPDEYYNKLLTYSAALKQDVGDLPGGVIGLHWFRDRLYAVADTAVIAVTSGYDLYPNAVLSDGGDPGTTARVLDVYKVDDSQIVFLDWLGPITPDTEFFLDGNSIGTIETPTVIPYGGKLLASMYESRTPQQAKNEGGDYEDSGWNFQHLGWEVLFANMVSSFGDLTALNQNKQDVGVQGPTPIDGIKGSPSSLTQDVPIIGAPEQVNGWKDSNTPTSYTLNAGALQEEDDRYIYADAYISWDSTTGALIGDTGVLQEYSASATVEVDI